MGLNTNVLLIVLIGAMVLVAGVQAVQIGMMSNTISKAGIGAAASTPTTTAKAPATSGHSGGSADLSKLEGMVGGC